MLIEKISKVPVIYLIDKIYRITLYSVSLVRVEYSKKGLFDDANPLILDPSFNEVVPHKVKQTKKFFILLTKYFELKLKSCGKRFDI